MLLAFLVNINSHSSSSVSCPAIFVPHCCVLCQICAQLAVKLGLPQVLESIISTLARSLHPLSLRSMSEPQLNATLASNNSMRYRQY